MTKIINGQREHISDLEKENEQLKKEVKRLSHEQMCDADLIQQLRNALYSDSYKEFIKYRNNFAEVCEELAEVNKEYGNLERENEQLKKENTHIHNINKEYREENLKIKEECIRLRKEIEELKSFKKQVFDLIEDKIQIPKIRVEELRKDAYEKGYPYDPYFYWGVELGLKDLKKELQE